jgi:ribosomal protein L37E
MDNDECGICGGPIGVMGILGNREHLQCRNCGASFSSEVDIDECNESDGE